MGEPDFDDTARPTPLTVPVSVHDSSQQPAGSHRSEVLVLVESIYRVIDDLNAAPMTWLAPYERLRARSFRSWQSQQAYLAAHWLARVAAGRLLGAAPATLMLTQRCAECGGPHGRPEIAGHPSLHVSLSHADAVVAAAAAWHPVAVDVEEWRQIAVDELLAAPVFTKSERNWIEGLPVEHRPRAGARLWVHKECFVKLGQLSLDDFAHCDLAPVISPLPLDNGLHRGIHQDRGGFVQWCDDGRQVTAAACCAATHARFVFETF